MTDNIVKLGQVDNRKFDLSQTQAVVMPPELEELIVVPTTEEQNISASKGKYFKDIKVEAVTSDIDKNIQENNIRQGVTILGKTGNLAPDKPDQTKTTIPTKERQVVKADTGFELFENIVEPIPDEFIITSDADAVASDILNGKTAYVNGEKITGDFIPLDVSDTTATAGDVATGKVFYDKDGVKTEGSGNLERQMTSLSEYPLPEEFNALRYTQYIKQYTTKFGDLFVWSEEGSNVDNGFFYLNKKTGEFNKFYSIATSSSFDNAIKFLELENGDAIIYSHLGGFMPKFFEKETGIFYETTALPYSTSSIFQGKSGKIYALVNNRIFVFDFELKDFVLLDFKNNYTYMTATPDGIFVNYYSSYNTNPASIYKINENDNSIVLINELVKPNSYSYYQVRYVDGIGTIIDGQSKNGVGLAIYDAENNSFNVVDGSESMVGFKWFSSMFFTSDGEIIFSGSDMPNYYYWEKQTKTFKDVGIIKTSYNTFYEDSNGNIFGYKTYDTGTQKGVWLFDKENKVFNQLSVMQDVYQFFVLEYNNNTYFASNKSNASLGVFVFNNSTKDLEQFSNLTTGYGTFIFNDVDNLGTLFGFKSTGATFLRAIGSDTFEQFYSKAVYPQTVFIASNGDIYINGNAYLLRYRDGEVYAFGGGIEANMQIVEFDGDIFTTSYSYKFDKVFNSSSGRTCRIDGNSSTDLFYGSHNSLLYVENDELYLIDMTSTNWQKYSKVARMFQKVNQFNTIFPDGKSYKLDVNTIERSSFFVEKGIISKLMKDARSLADGIVLSLSDVKYPNNKYTLHIHD